MGSPTHLEHTVAVDQEVARFDVSVQDAGRMKVFQSWQRRKTEQRHMCEAASSNVASGFIYHHYSHVILPQMDTDVCKPCPTPRLEAEPVPSLRGHKD